MIVYPQAWTSTPGMKQCNVNSFDKLSRTDYAANGGDYAGGLAWSWNPGDPSGQGNPSFTDAPGFAWPDKSAMTGVIYATSTLRIAEIYDGTSNTYLLGEKSIDVDHYFDGEQYSDNNSAYGGNDWDYARWGDRPPLPDRSGQWDDWAFGSAHDSGFHVALCDGSVRMVNYSIDPATHAHLCNRKDGYVIDGRKF